MATSLFSHDCNAISDATQLFATEKGLIVIRPKQVCCSLFLSIPSECYALVTSHGADLDYENDNNPSSPVWPPGIHYPHPPWVGVSHLITKQSIVFDLPVKACKTKDNVTVNIDVAIVFRIMGDIDLGEDPKLVRNFVHELKPRGLEQQLRDSQEEAVRGLVRSLRHTEVYGIRGGKMQALQRGSKTGEDFNTKDGGLGKVTKDDKFENTSDISDRNAAKWAAIKGGNATETMREQLNKQFMPQGVEIQSIIIKSIELPEDIVNQMYEKTMIISQNAQQVMHHEHEMQLIRMEQEIKTMKQSFLEEQEIEKSSGEEVLNSETVKLNDEAILAGKSVANIKEETRVRIQMIHADTAYEVQKVHNNMHVATEKINAESMKLCAEQHADTKLHIETLLSQSKLIKEKNKALAQQVISEAEGKMAPWLSKKKDFETQMKQIEVYQKLVENQDLIICGSTDEDLNLIAVADAIINGSTTPSHRSYWIAHLALMKKGTADILSNPSFPSKFNVSSIHGGGSISSISSPSSKNSVEIHEFHSILEEYQLQQQQQSNCASLDQSK